MLERSSKPHIGVLQISRGEAWLIMESRNMPYDISIPLKEIDRWFGKGGILDSIHNAVSGADEEMPQEVVGTGGNAGTGSGTGGNAGTGSTESGGREVPQRTWKPGEVSGLKAAVIVTDWPRKAPAPTGRIIDVLGEPGANDTEMHAILAEYGLPYRFESTACRTASSPRWKPQPKPCLTR